MESNDFPIRESSFLEVMPIWQKELWPNRQSAIEERSYLLPDGSIDMQLAAAKPRFLIASCRGEVVATISGHSTGRGNFRFRGVWVHQAHRRKGLASRLILEMMKHAERDGFENFWGMPRISSWSIYEKMGFHIFRQTHQYEFGPHYVVMKPLRELSAHDNIGFVEAKI